VVIATQMPRHYRDRMRRPIVISGNGQTGAYQIGDSVSGQFMVPSDLAKGAWIGVLPYSVSPLGDSSSVARIQINSGTGEFSWQADRAGSFVFRVFTPGAPGQNFIYESMPFNVDAAAAGGTVLIP
jgi:hypothetical protein